MAKRRRVSEAILRLYERSGLLPPWGAVPEQTYADLLTILLAARRKLSGQRIRRALRAHALNLKVNGG